jgi:hypothetical protein
MGHSPMRAALIYQHAARERDHKIKADISAHRLRPRGEELVPRAPTKRTGTAEVLDDMGARTYIAGQRMCGAEGNRTPDLLDANESRYQLRHSPVPASGRALTTLAAAHWPEARR